MEALDILMKVKGLLSEPSSWIKGGYARDKDDNSVLEDSPDACKWCLSGALMRFHEQDNFVVANSAVLDVLPPNKYRDISFFNDQPETTHSDIMNVIDASIQRLSVV